MSKNLIIIARFIQNQAQRGPRSATLIQYDANRRDLLLIFESFLDHLDGLFRDFKHEFLP